MLPLQNGGMEFWPMIHDRVKIVTKGARDIAYEYRPPQGQPITIPREQVLHFSGFSIEGFMGRGIRRDGIDAIGRLKGTETYGASMLKHGAIPGGALRHPKRLSPEARSNMRRDWESVHAGARQAHTVAILEEGVEWVQTGVAPKDAQMLETMQFQVLEIARLTNTPPHLLMDLSKINIANVAELARQWLIFSQGPVLRDIELVFRTMCFPRTEWHRYSLDFDTEQIQRPDMKTFYESLNTATGRPFMSVNEARARAGMGPVDNGDDILQPLNMGNPGGDPAAPNEPVAPPPAEEIESD
jgi:HK97 family phage portal protein